MLSNNVFPCIFFIISISGAKNSIHTLETYYEVTSENKNNVKGKRKKVGENVK
jgi:hypothetical protein